MSLYFVRHQHSAETCPAKNPEMGQMLLQHLSKANARKFGVDLIGDAVLDGQHTLVLIAEAEDQEYLENYMQPFAMAGSVEILAASTCEAVVERQGCDPVPAGD
jgi:ribosomal protein L7Ae-like RNA K-turn-binding protein